MSTILLIEDDPTMRHVTSETLKLSGYKVLTAENGKVGVDTAKKEPIDLIICDIEMPELDGYGVQKIINSQASLIHTPFIFLSGKSNLSDIRKGMDLGADDYLVKPLRKTDLLSAVESRIAKTEKIKEFYHFSKSAVTKDGVKTLFDLADGENSVVFRRNSFIYREGDPATGLYFIKEGQVKVSKANSEGKEFVSNILSSGSFIGHHALIKDTVHKEEASAIDDVVVINIPKEKFYSVMRLDPKISLEFLKILNNKLEESEDRLLSLAYDTVRKRTADALLSLEKKFKRHSQESMVEIRISRDDLAAIVGTASESVIRVLRDFKKSQIIEIKGRTIQILDVDRLENNSF